MELTGPALFRLALAASCGVAAPLSAGGCISNPTPHPAADARETGSGGGADTHNVAEGDSGDGKGSDAVGGDTAVGDTSVGDTTLPPAPTFPPIGPTIVLRDVLVRDLDGDGFDDVLLTNAPDAAPQDWGVYVMRGGAGRVGLDASDQFIATQARPDQVLPTHLTDAAGGFELTTFGATGTGGDASGVLAIHPYDGARFGDPIVRVTSAPGFDFTPAGGTEDAGQPVLLAEVDVTGDGQADLVLGDLYHLYALHPETWTAEGFGAGDHTALVPDPTFNAILQVFPITFGEATWLAVLQQDMQVRYIPLDATGIALSDEVSLDLNDEQGIRATELTDFDADGVTDITTVSTDTLSLIRFEPPTAELFELDPDVPTVGDDWFEDVAVGDVDGSGADDVVLLDSDANGVSQSKLWLLRDPAPDEDSGNITFLSDFESLTLPIGRRPRHLAVGRFGAEGVRVWTFDLDGTPHCYRWDGAGSELATCASP